MATAPMQSMDLGRVLSTGFNALLRNAVPFLAVSFILAGLPGFALEYWLQSLGTEAPSAEFVLSWQFWGPMLGSVLAGIVSGALLQGTLSGATVRHLSGRPAHIGQSVAGALARIVPIVLLSLLVGLCIMFGFLLLIVPGIIFYLMFIVAVPVMMAEGRGVTGSMSRSAELTKGSRPMIFLLAVIMLMVAGGLTAVCNAIFVRLTEVSGDAAMDQITLSVGALVNQTVMTAISAVIAASLYIELRNV
ncbi:hypothetical protein, partial [Sphingosinicella sp.]|uniref:hypothetical protein n=1 Tax=Sphingosinicella sp. TaxID=1917971 RepID=UPI0040380E05